MPQIHYGVWHTVVLTKNLCYIYVPLLSHLYCYTSHPIWLCHCKKYNPIFHQDSTIIFMVETNIGWFMVLNATFNNISVLLEEETRVSGEKPPTCHKSLTNYIT
jgi:hypothetical protein